MDERTRCKGSNKQHQDEFLQRFFSRRPEARQYCQRRRPAPEPCEIMLETIFNDDRPVLFVREDCKPSTRPRAMD
jgi:hypothetical protein